MIEQLLHRDERLDRGSGGLVLLGGESGIGKTFLVAEFARNAQRRRRRVLTGECVPVNASPTAPTEFSAGPLHPLRGVLRCLADECSRGGRETTERLLKSRASLLAEYEPAFSAFADPAANMLTRELPPQAARERILECLAETLAAFSMDVPLVIALDDLQWADELTLAFLASLPRSFFEKRPLLIVGTYRVEEVGPELQRLLEEPSIEPLRVGRLDEDSLEAIVRDMLSMKNPPLALRRFLAARAEGNPFFIAEYLRLLVAEGILQRIDGRWSVSLGGEPSSDYSMLPAPQSLEVIVNRRLVRLSARALTTIEAASILGRDFAVATLAAITGLSDVEMASALREAQERQVVEVIDDDHYRFSHDKLRESAAAFAERDLDRSRELHRLAASSIEAARASSPEFPAYFADLARHYRAAGEVQKTVEYLEKAGHEALAKSANREAISFLTDAIEHAKGAGMFIEPVRLARWHREIGDGLQAVGELEESAAHLRRAAALLGRPSPSSRPRLAVAVATNVLRQVLHRTLPRFVSKPRHPGAEELVEAARTHYRLLQIFYYAGDSLAMLHACVSHLNLAESAGASEELASAYSNAFAVAAIAPARALAGYYRRCAREIVERNPGNVAQCYLCMQSGIYSVGAADWKEASRELEKGMALAEALGFRRGWEDCCSVDSIGDYIQGAFQRSFEKANALYQSALRGDEQTQAWGLIQRAYVLLVEGRLEESFSSLRKAEPLVGEQEKSRIEYLWFHSALARTHLRRGNPAGALAAARLALARLAKSPPIYFAWIEAYSALAEVFIELLDSASAAEYRSLLGEARRTCKAMHAQARVFAAAEPQAHFWQGQLNWHLGDRGGAIQSLERAVTTAKKLSMRYEEASALGALAITLNDASSRSRLDYAQRTLAELGAHYEIGRLTTRAVAPRSA
jgi:hypothetical protein